MSDKLMRIAEPGLLYVWPGKVETFEPPVVPVEVADLPQRYFVLGQIAPQWVVLRPLPVTLERDTEGAYMVSDALFCVYGWGRTLAEAHQDYLTSLIEYYQIIQDHEDDLTQVLFRRLQTYLARLAEPLTYADQNS